MSLFVATPCYGGNVSSQFLNSILELQKLCIRLNINFTLYTIPFDSLIPRARNVCANVFLNDYKEYNNIMFIDADIKFHPISVIKMLKANKSVICGAYPKKTLVFDKIKEHANKCENIEQIISKSTSYAINFEPDIEGKITIQQDLVELKDAPTGFLMIKRTVLEDMIKNNIPQLYVNDIRAYGYGKNFYDFFPIGVFEDSKRYLSEDYGFCRLCKKLNVKLYCDIAVKLTHIGPFQFFGDLGSYIRN